MSTDTLPRNLASVKSTSSQPSPGPYAYGGGMSEEDERDRPWGDIADRLRAARKVFHMEQREFAAGAGIKHSAYRNWETGLYRVSLDGALALRKRYGLSLDFIYEGNLDALPMNIRKALSDSPRDR